MSPPGNRSRVGPVASVQPSVATVQQFQVLAEVNGVASGFNSGTKLATVARACMNVTRQERGWHKHCKSRRGNRGSRGKQGKQARGRKAVGFSGMGQGHHTENKQGRKCKRHKGLEKG